MPFMRAMSMEQRWQDLASLLSLPGAPEHFPHTHPGYPGHGISHSHYEAQRNVLLHNATLAPPVGDLNSTSPYHNVGKYFTRKTLFKLLLDKQKSKSSHTCEIYFILSYAMIL